MIQTIQGLLPQILDAHKKTPAQIRVNALMELNSLLSSCDNFKNIEPYLVYNIIPVLLKRLDDKPEVIEIANKNCEVLVSNISIQGLPQIISILKEEMKPESKWKAKIGSLNFLSNYLKRVFSFDRDLLSACLPELVTIITPMLHDTKPEVAKLSKDVLHQAMKGITNRDLEPFVDQLLNAIIHREDTEETIQQLGGVVFVQTVEGSALSVVIPLMIAGFRQSKAIVKRMCSRIVSNMSKLVEEPSEAAPFLDELIPALTDAIDTIADPEAREVASSTLTSLNKIKLSVVIKEFCEPVHILAQLNNKFSNITECNDMTLNYISQITAALIKTKTVEKSEYFDEISPFCKNEDVIDFLFNESRAVINIEDVQQDEEEDNNEELCDCEFTLAYGTKILLHNTRMKLKKGRKYGLLGQNDCGKTTLMKAIADGSVDGFPDASEIRTVFVEADIQGELSHLNCVDYVLEFPAIKKANITRDQVQNILEKVGFSKGRPEGGNYEDPISSLSGGWRMKLALARAMLQRADILLMDEPTNHLDVKNVKWVESYINSLKDTTVIMVSHDSGLLDHCCDYILQIDKLKLKLHRGNLSEFVKSHPEANSYFEFKANKFKFNFPQPCFLEGVKSRGKALLKMDNVSLIYPGNTEPTIQAITVRTSMASRVACVGVNGAGKSTMIKVLTGELEPTSGTVWKFPNARIGYIAQHAFHHIEKHLNKTPNEYIRWRFQFGDDREGLDKAAMKLNDNDLEELGKPIEYSFKTESGQIKKEKRIVDKCTGQRREMDGKKKVFEYEVNWKDKPHEYNSWLKAEDLVKFHKIYEKVIKMIDQKIAARENLFSRPLTMENVEKHLADTGLESEYASHFRINALSGGQKVKVVLAAAMWDQPHILILDEPTNYLDRDSLGALAEAIEKYEGGIIMITHNDAFCRQLCPERWVLEKGRLNTEGDVEWMSKVSDQAVGFQEITEMVDATGNEIKLKSQKKLNAKEKKRLIKVIKQKIANNEDLDIDEEEYAIEWNL
jgi:elongation factor 3